MEQALSPYVELKGITKTFGTVVANKDVNFSVNKGEVHAILGENGSGKSTLMNMLSGIYSPDSGEILVEGEPLHISSPIDAIRSGIGMIHQHFKLVEAFTALENIVLGRVNTFLFKPRKLKEDVKAICERYTLKCDLDQRIYSMSVSQKQTVEIVKVLYGGAKLLILDEPTAVLTPQEIRNLFEILRNMRNEGCAIVIITHKLNEVMEISDRITVLRKGQSIATVNTAETSPKELTEMMVGRPVSLEIERLAVDEENRKLMLKVDGLTVENRDREGAHKAIENMSFELYTGEILGVAGIAGSGQKELCEAIAGLMTVEKGSAKFKGEEIIGLNPRTIIQKGIRVSFVPEDRLGMGLIGGMSIIDNILLKDYYNDKGMFISRKNSKRISQDIIKKYDIQTPSMYHEVKKLSGGNIQKVLLGREIQLSPQLLITAYPVRGLDIGASYQVYDLINEEKKNGVAVMFIGEDLDVLLSISDRIMVLSQGKVMGIYSTEKITKEQVGLLMLGHNEEVELNGNA